MEIGFIDFQGLWEGREKQFYRFSHAFLALLCPRVWAEMGLTPLPSHGIGQRHFGLPLVPVSIFCRRTAKAHFPPAPQVVHSCTQWYSKEPLWKP